MLALAHAEIAQGGVPLKKLFESAAESKARLLVLLLYVFCGMNQKEKLALPALVQRLRALLRVECQSHCHIQRTTARAVVCKASFGLCFAQALKVALAVPIQRGSELTQNPAKRDLNDLPFFFVFTDPYMRRNIKSQTQS